MVLVGVVVFWLKDMWVVVVNCNFVVVFGWIIYDFGCYFQDGFKVVVGELGGNLNMIDVGFDVCVQFDQIDFFVVFKLDVFFIMFVDVVVIVFVVLCVIKVGILVFCVDSVVFGVMVMIMFMFNNFGMGQYFCEFICQQLKGKGKIVCVMLLQNESWDQCMFGMEWMLCCYFDVKVVVEWVFVLVGNVILCQVVDNILIFNLDVDVIWCVWDGVVVEGMFVVCVVNCSNFIFIGIDGGLQVFNYIVGDMLFKLFMVQSFYEMVYLSVFYVYEQLVGCKVLWFVIMFIYVVVKDMFQKGILDDYDVFGYVVQFGWMCVF